jgi:CHASE2 domain-containing sensor protein
MNRSGRNRALLIRYVLITSTLIFISAVIFTPFGAAAVLPVILILILSLVLITHNKQTLRCETQKVIILTPSRGPPQR